MDGQTVGAVPGDYSPPWFASERPPTRPTAAPRFDLADILRTHLPAYSAQRQLSKQQWRVARALVACRTAALGGRIESCRDCEFRRARYNSCRDRHCPKCQGARQLEWVEARTQKLLPVGYFHCVFTLPEPLRKIAMLNEELVYSLLFRCSADTVLTLGRDPKWYGAKLGLLSVLHTWARDLSYHPHVHCIVTGGGLTPEGTWRGPKQPRFLLPVKVMGALFRGKFLAAIREAYERGELVVPEELQHGHLFDAFELDLRRKSWVVYAKAPFAGPEMVLQYLGRYTHRVGLSNRRILDVRPDAVVLATRGEKSVTLHPLEFVRRFLQHVLPHGFVKIRHYGLWASACRKDLERALEVLGVAAAKVEAAATPSNDAVEAVAGVAACPSCGSCSGWSSVEIPRPAHWTRRHRSARHGPDR